MRTSSTFIYDLTRCLLLIFIVILLNACGGSDNNNSNGGSNPPPSNTAPIASAGSDQSVDEQNMVTLDASGSADSDGSISSYLWSQTAGTTVTLSDPSSIAATFTSPTVTQPDTLTFSLTVTDNDGATATDSISVNVTPVNLPPMANAGGEQTVDELTQISLNAGASNDTDGSIVSYMWVQTAGSSVVLSDSTISNPTFMSPDVDAVETLSFELSVTDNEGQTATSSVNIFINPTADNAIPASQLERAMLLNELYFEYADMIGQKVWVLGYYGNTEVNGDGIGFLVDNMLRLEVDERFAHHSFTRVDGNLPPDDWHGNQIMLYGEIKDYAVESGTNAIQPTPLISVEKYELISAATTDRNWDDLFVTPDMAEDQGEKSASVTPEIVDYLYQPKPLSMFAKPAPGTQAQECDRSIIISGGVDDSNNHQRYIDNVVAKFNKMKELGFSDDQIEVFYNNGGAINVNGSNIVDAKTSIETISEHIEQLTEKMSGSCTLTIFVTDHGAGHSQEQGYSGAKPVFSGKEFNSGKVYDENTFAFDARKKTYHSSAAFAYQGSTWFVVKNEAGEIKLYKRVGDTFQFRGSNENDDNIISETEAGEDFNGDGDSNDNFGVPVAWLETKLNTTNRKYKSNQWDSDGDGSVDIRLRWDGQRFVVERLNAEEKWQEMGRDTNGDYFIDILDGGVDWNLDGDVADQVGFHESINLWGNEELYDDAFADMLKPLSDKGVHIMMEMVSCFSGGFINNLKDYVENIYTGASEDTKHYNRYSVSNTLYASDELAFLDNLVGIDTDSWNAAADAATAKDDNDAEINQGRKNIHMHEQTLRFETETTFMEDTGEDEYLVELDLPDDKVGEIYDFEFILGLQKPRWSEIDFPYGLPEGWQTEAAPGGIRVYSDTPIEDGQVFSILVNDEEVGEQIRIGFTDINHQRLGYTMANEGEVEIPAPQLSFATGAKTCVNHTDHGQSSPSIMEWLVAANQVDNTPFADIQLTVKITTPVGEVTQNVTLNAVGQLYLLLQIYSYGNYQMEVIGARIVPTDVTLELVGLLTYPFTVNSSETNKGQCTPDE